MQLGGLIRSRGFCPSESFVCSQYPAFDRRGAERAGGGKVVFNPSARRAARALQRRREIHCEGRAPACGCGRNGIAQPANDGSPPRTKELGVCDCGTVAERSIDSRKSACRSAPHRQRWPARSGHWPPSKSRPAIVDVEKGAYTLRLPLPTHRLILLVPIRCQTGQRCPQGAMREHPRAKFRRRATDRDHSR
jgi:hypothetical protein